MDVKFNVFTVADVKPPTGMKLPTFEDINHTYIGPKLKAMEKWGLAPMVLTEELANFYLLYSLCLEGKAVAEFDSQLNRLEAQFRAYTDMAVGGELRHARGLAHKHKQYVTVISIPAPLRAAFNDGHLPDNRHEAWLGWFSFRLKYGTVALLWAEKVFNYMGGAYGGKKWANIAKVLRMYETGKLTKITFVDTCWGLQHNGGIYLNKIWGVGHVQDLLSSVRSDQTQELVPYASKEVKKLWNGLEAEKS